MLSVVETGPQASTSRTPSALVAAQPPVSCVLASTSFETKDEDRVTPPVKSDVRAKKQATAMPFQGRSRTGITPQTRCRRCSIGRVGATVGKKSDVHVHEFGPSKAQTLVTMHDTLPKPKSTVRRANR